MNDDTNPYEKIVEDMRNESYEGEAGFIIRSVSLIIDITLLSLIAGLMGASTSPEEGNIGFSLDGLGIVIFVIYYLVLEWSPLQGTVGKLLLGLKTCDEFGARLSLGKSLLRCISRGVTFFTLLLGFFTILFRDDNRALHDFMSSTYVLVKSIHSLPYCCAMAP